jgi:prepilin-type N-terminal cleavage/methylation domain-containing protein
MNRNKHGFSLVELMVGVLIVSIAVLALYQMFIVGSQLITEEYHRRLALERAQALMEAANYYPTHGKVVPQTMAGTFEDLLVPPTDAPGDDGITAEYTMTVTPSSDFYNYSNRPIYNYVTIKYNWVEKSKREQMVQLECFF